MFFSRPVCLRTSVTCSSPVPENRTCHTYGDTAPSLSARFESSCTGEGSIHSQSWLSLVVWCLTHRSLQRGNLNRRPLTELLSARKLLGLGCGSFRETQNAASNTASKRVVWSSSLLVAVGSCTRCTGRNDNRSATSCCLGSLRMPGNSTLGAGNDQFHFDCHSLRHLKHRKLGSESLKRPRALQPAWFSRLLTELQTSATPWPCLRGGAVHLVWWSRRLRYGIVSAAGIGRRFEVRIATSFASTSFSNRAFLPPCRC